MDNLVLIRVAGALHEALAGGVLEAFRQESAHRWRLTFADASGQSSALVVSLAPELPWIGRPAMRWEGPPWSPAPFTVLAAHALRGLRVERIEKVGAGRVLRLSLGGGRALVAELATHGANLVALDAHGRVEGAALHPKSGHERLGEGEAYDPPRLPSGALVPWAASSAEIDAAVAAAVAGGEPLIEAVRRRLFGVGTAGARLVVGEATARRLGIGDVLLERLASLAQGRLDPVIEGPGDPLEAAERGSLDPAVWTLHPWPPAASPAGMVLAARADAAATAGLWHEALERGRWLSARLDALRTLARHEARRAAEGARRARGDVAAFEAPERWRHRGEALLAGLRSARRAGDLWIVADPYDPDGLEIAVPAAPGTSPQAAAEECFRRHRRARRGLEAAGKRAEALEARAERLEAIAASIDEAPASDAARTERDISHALREAGIAVGLRAATRAQRATRRVTLPRPEGVRLYTSRDGLTILVGKTGRDNDRLTFKIAAPDDFWFHASGVAGAHVVVRNTDRLPRPPAATLGEAAAAAAWFSEAKGHAAADVSWTRRKYVRRARGGAPGLVLLKRFETIRVRPAAPAGEQRT